MATWDHTASWPKDWHPNRREMEEAIARMQIEAINNPLASPFGPMPFFSVPAASSDRLERRTFTVSDKRERWTFTVPEGYTLKGFKFIFPGGRK